MSDLRTEFHAKAASAVFDTTAVKTAPGAAGSQPVRAAIQKAASWIPSLSRGAGALPSLPPSPLAPSSGFLSSPSSLSERCSLLLPPPPPPAAAAAPPASQHGMDPNWDGRSPRPRKKKKAKNNNKKNNSAQKKEQKGRKKERSWRLSSREKRRESKGSQHCEKGKRTYQRKDVRVACSSSVSCCFIVHACCPMA